MWEALSAGLSYDASRRPASCADLVAELEPRGVGTNLPAFETRFIGRESDIAAVTATLRDGRLVSLVGTGGLGKTRLAVEAARKMAPAYPDGVWIAELASVRDPELVTRAVAHVLGVDTSDGRVFDINLSHSCTTGCCCSCSTIASTCSRHALHSSLPVLRACPGIDVIATSRERLGLENELVHEVLPLAAPRRTTPHSRASSSRRACSSSWTAHATYGWTRARHRTCRGSVVGSTGCRWRSSSPRPVPDGCRSSRSPSASKTDSHCCARTVKLSPRHQTLLAAFDWSLSLLSSAQRALFVGLSVLPAGVGVDVACAVAAQGRETADVFSDLEELVAKSLLARTNDRYTMLESVRSFAAAALERDGATEAIYDRALVWAGAFCAEAGAELEGAERAVWLQRLEDDLDNIRAVTRRRGRPTSSRRAAARHCRWGRFGPFEVTGPRRAGTSRRAWIPMHRRQ